MKPTSHVLHFRSCLRVLEYFGSIDFPRSEGLLVGLVLVVVVLRSTSRDNSVCTYSGWLVLLLPWFLFSLELY